MARSVYEVEFVFFTLFICIGEGDRLALDGDPALSLELHGVQHLIPKISLRDQTRCLDEPVCQGGLPMVDVGYDAEVSDM